MAGLVHRGIIGYSCNMKGAKGGRIYIITDSSDKDPVNANTGTLFFTIIQGDPLGITFCRHLHSPPTESCTTNGWTLRHGVIMI